MPYLLALTLLLTPLYVWRFSFGGIPLNFLLIWVVVVWIAAAAWLLKRGQTRQFIDYCRNLDRKLLLLIALFFLAGCISLFAGGIDREKIGQFLVLFIQPLSLFFLGSFLAEQVPHTRVVFRRAVYVMVAICGAVALAQYFTLATLPPEWWGNANEPKRAIGLFAHPDMFGLFLAPLLAWLVPDILRRLDSWKEATNAGAILAWLLGCAGLLLSLSRGAWIGFAVAAVAGIIAFGRSQYWKWAVVAAACLGIVIIAAPNLRYRLILPFMGEKSSVARLSLWHTGEKMVASSPLLGKGLNGFKDNWYVYNADPGLDHYNFPHNIILNFWVDTGLLGVLSFAALLVYGLWYGFRNRRSPYALGLGLFLLALAVHGFIDTPYLKNDLAIAFWLVWAMRA